MVAVQPHQTERDVEPVLAAQNERPRVEGLASRRGEPGRPVDSGLSSGDHKRMSLPNADASEPTASRSSRRNRRMVLIGALALVLVAGVVLVGVQINGARSGALVGAITCVNSDNGDSNQSVSWTDDADTTGGTYIINYYAAGGSQVARVPGNVANTTYKWSLPSGTTVGDWTVNLLVYADPSGAKKWSSGPVNCLWS